MGTANFISSLYKNRELIRSLTSREIRTKYKGTIMGLSWGLLQPIIMLGVYTFVFSTIFKSRWIGFEEAGVAGYALNLFAGLIVFNLFGESMISSTSLITSNVAFVKKVVFPLEVLGVTAVSAATYHAAIGMLVLCLFELVTLHRIPLTIVCLPIVVGPLIMGCIALSWIISAA